MAQLSLTSRINSHPSRISPGYGRFPLTMVSIGLHEVVHDYQGAHTHIYPVLGEESVYLPAQDGALLADNAQQQQRRQWGVESIPPFHPSSSALAPVMEQFQWFWFSPSANAGSVPPGPSCYPSPESLSDSPTHNDLLDVLLDDGFEWTIFSSPILTNFEEYPGEYAIGV